MADIDLAELERLLEHSGVSGLSLGPTHCAQMRSLIERVKRLEGALSEIQKEASMRRNIYANRIVLTARAALDGGDNGEPRGSSHDRAGAAPAVCLELWNRRDGSK